MRNIIFLAAIVLTGLISPFVIANEGKHEANTENIKISASDGLKKLIDGNK